MEIKIKDMKSSGISEISFFKILNHSYGRESISISDLVYIIGIDETLLYISKNIEEAKAKKIIFQFARMCAYSVDSFLELELNGDEKNEGAKKLHDFSAEIARNPANIGRPKLVFSAYAIMNYANALMAPTITQSAHYAAEAAEAAQNAVDEKMEVYHNLINAINGNK
jgi:hypothetical protein